MKNTFIMPLLITAALLCMSSCVHEVINPRPVPPPPDRTGVERFNQLGYYPKSVKTLVVADTDKASFEIVDSNMNVVFTGTLVSSGRWGASGENVKIGDFTAFEAPGSYTLRLDEIETYFDFEISDNVYADVLKATLKSYYYLRSSTDLPAAYAGQWERAAGHPDTNCILHDSTGKTGSISSPGGWYDAGDYGKYVVNAGITVSTLLSLYELYPAVVADDLNIPESGNGRSDLLDEVKYELDWLKTMQDSDGGVFFKIGGASWPGSIMPVYDTQPRYVFGKSTTSSLNFAAVMAQAGRIFIPIDPAYAKDCLRMATEAWNWARLNDTVTAPTHTGGTGPYFDTEYSDEFLWAASELYASTKDATYKAYIESTLTNPVVKGKAWWQDTLNLAYFALISHSTDIDPSLINKIKAELITYADSIVSKAAANPYRTPIEEYDFTWGSHSNICNYGVMLVYAYEMTADAKYMDTAISILDYVFGKNATGYTAVTGFGENSPRFPHHRQSEADSIWEPVPGLVVGGPNKQQEDSKEVNYHSSLPAKSYMDRYASWASNENAINQNAPMVFLLGFINNYKALLN